jgi:hypothetical protein
MVDKMFQIIESLISQTIICIYKTYFFIGLAWYFLKRKYFMLAFISVINTVPIVILYVIVGFVTNWAYRYIILMNYMFYIAQVHITDANVLFRRLMEKDEEAGAASIFNDSENLSGWIENFAKAVLTEAEISKYNEC